MSTTATHIATPERVWRQDCRCPGCNRMRDAVRRLVRSFHQIPTQWLQKLLEADGESPQMPMWGTCFLVDSHSLDIQRLLEPKAGPGAPEELEGLLADAWWSVAETGLYARWYDDEFILGVDGAGYSFYEDHWHPLYRALKYDWHVDW